MATGGLHRLAVLNDRVHRGLIGLYTQSMLISELTQRIFMLVGKQLLQPSALSSHGTHF
jgi:hypothetical protein